ncbi:MAG TPA: DNA replication protein [Stellaceae bacterium]|jgi:chromosomal replication initiation ATPase DnaA|nr:DNA replication protein [Stellaceae bacterium]
MKQLTMDLPSGPPSVHRADFVVSDCNAEAFGWIERWPAWPAPALVLHGPPSSGKSHLARLWRGRSGATLLSGDALPADPHALAQAGPLAIDDAEHASETALLHFFNCCNEMRTTLLIVAQEAPARWGIALPDLASRLRAAPSVGIAAPDDALLAAILAKHFADRQVRVGPGLIAFLLRRMPRTFTAAAAAVDMLDRASLGAQRAITIAFARDILAATLPEIGDQL